MLKIRSLSACIFLCGILSTGRAFSGDIFSCALRLYSEKEYYSASIEFERSIFYETDYIRIAQCKLYKALCYKNLGDVSGAVEELSEVNMFNLPDTLFFMIRYEQSLCSFLENEPEKSLLFIEELYSRFTDSLQIQGVIPLNILCLNSCRKWGEAKNLWYYFLDRAELPDSVKVPFKCQVASLYDKKSIPGYRSPGKAENLSRFIPGSGQIYCGKAGEGMVNFGINAAILGFALYEFYTGFYFTGYIAGLTVLNKTYKGGIHRAGILAKEVNLKRMKDFNLKADLLLKENINIINSSGEGINGTFRDSLIN